MLVSEADDWDSAVANWLAGELARECGKDADEVADHDETMQVLLDARRDGQEAAELEGDDQGQGAERTRSDEDRLHPEAIRRDHKEAPQQDPWN